MGLPDLPANEPGPRDPADAGTATGESGEITPGSDIAKDNQLDHRHFGDWGSRYTKSAWLQISIEFFYLVSVLLFSAIILLRIGYYVAAPDPLDQREFTIFGVGLIYPRDRAFLLWVSIGMSGVVGGTSFALKWLYHSVAKASWNRDRILWRLIVPLLSGTVATFVSMLISSGVLAIIDARFFQNFYGALGTGWVLGYFSDHVLASLQKRALKWFGTVDEPKGDSPDSHPPSPDAP